MIRQFVFDLGRVLLRFEPEEYLRSMVSEEETPVLMANIFRSQEWLDLDRGVLSEDDAATLISARIPALGGTVERILREWPSILTPIEGSVALLKEVRSQGYRTYLLSNFHRNAFQDVLGRYDFFNLFDGMLVSYEVGLLKPEPAIFDRLCHTFAIDPAESIFIDDHAPNIAAGIESGFRTVHFQDPLQCRRAVGRILRAHDGSGDFPDCMEQAAQGARTAERAI